MGTREYELEGRLAEVAASVAFVAVALLLLWPPGRVYWTTVAGVLGDAVTLAVVGLLAVAAGVWFQRLSAFHLGHVALGALVAYALGMAGVALVLSPDSPAHLLLYAALAAATIGGAILWRATNAVGDSSQ